MNCKLFHLLPVHRSSVGSKQKVAGLIPGSARFFHVIDDTDCDGIYSSLTAGFCLDDDYVRKQQVALKGDYA